MRSESLSRAESPHCSSVYRPDLPQQPKHPFWYGPPGYPYPPQPLWLRFFLGDTLYCNQCP